MDNHFLRSRSCFAAISFVGLVVIIIGVTLSSVIAQGSKMVQDSTLNNLVHPPGYKTCDANELGNVIKVGSGPTDMVLIAGQGFGGEIFREFMNRNKDRYTMYAVTMAGNAGTPAPPMPPEGTSYGGQTWTNGCAVGVAELIRTRDLDRPIIVGSFLNGTQVALRVALDNPDMVSGVVIAGGSTRWVWPERSQMPKPKAVEERAAAIDTLMAPMWFKTVTLETWIANNFKGVDYTTDSVRGEELAKKSGKVPLQVNVRYLCEFFAQNSFRDLNDLTVPTLVLQPGFTKEYREDSTKQYMINYCRVSWEGADEVSDLVTIDRIDDAHTLIWMDKPKEFDRRINEFVRSIS